MSAADTNNTLYVTTAGAFLSRDHENLVVRVDGEEKLRVPLHHVSSVVCFGATSLSVGAMAELAERGIGVSFLSESGRFLARVEGPWQGGSLLRRAQYEAASDAVRTASLGRAFIVGKLLNSRRLLMRSARDAEQEDAEALRKAAISLDRMIKAAAAETDLNSLRGHEGAGAAIYFGVFERMLRRRGLGFSLETRQRRPPRDPLNALLSFLYAVLLHEVSSALSATGLDPAVGFLHRDRPGRPSLGLDVMEEFRAALVDRAVLALVNRKQVDREGFETQEGGAVRMSDATRRAVLAEWQERRRQTLLHPVTSEQITYAVLPHVQARLLARFIRGDIEEYPPFLIEGGG